MIASTEHRPWPLPRFPWFLRMRWNDLAFLHWPVDPVIMRSKIPPEVILDVDGNAWLGITPFEMSNTRPRWLPPIPGLSTFPELNVRTYVTVNGKPGIWFLSLDADNRLAVRAARMGFGLPYKDADMAIDRADATVHYRSSRSKGDAEANFVARYRPTGDVYHSKPGTLEHWLTERYCLYTSCRGRILRGEIHHAPWPLQSATIEIEHNSMAKVEGFDLPPEPELVHFAKQLDVVGWYLTPAEKD
jgi:uncharacterized protein YqjF (DUF2071 family)